HCTECLRGMTEPARSSIPPAPWPADRRPGDEPRRAAGPWRHDLRPLIAMAVGVAALCWARDVLVPLALAAILTFLLAPIVAFLERRRLGRIAPVVIVVAMVFTLLGGIGWMLAVQAVSLRDDIPQYRDNLKAKIAAVRGAGKGGPLAEVQSALQEVNEELQRAETPPG